MNTIETALAISGLPIQAQACLAALSRGELGRFFLSPAGFFILYGGGVWTGSTAGFPQWDGAQGPGGQPTHAALFLQFEPATYDECARATGAIDIMPPSQIANGWWLAQHVSPNLLTMLVAGNLTGAASSLISTWDAGGGSNFPGFYASEFAILSAGAPAPPPPAPVGLDIAITDPATGKSWKGRLPQTAGALLLGVGLGAGGMATDGGTIWTGNHITTEMVQPAQNFGANRLDEFKACYRTMMHP